jgi:RHS repeat-associated protein
VDVYGYDAIDQVTTVKYNFDASNNTQDRLVGYNYDAVGNRSGANGVSDSVNNNTSYTANNLNQYTTVGSDSPQYDANGNLRAALVSGTNWSYQYDAQNRLVRASDDNIDWDFAYDGRNRCVRRTRTQHDPTGPTFSSATYFYYDGWNLVEEQDSENSLLAQYVRGPQTDELLNRATQDSYTYYYQDALGSTVALTDSSGNVIERYAYDVYGTPTFMAGGNSIVSSSVTGNRFFFTGREYLADLGLYDYRNRAYSPTFGRFLQTDPKRFDARDINLYRYAFNNPTNHADPFGLYCRLYGNRWQFESNNMYPNRPDIAYKCRYACIAWVASLVQYFASTEGWCDDTGMEHPDPVGARGQLDRYSEEVEVYGCNELP